MPISFHLPFPQGRPESGLPFENSLLRQSTPDYTLPAFSLSAIYRCVTRSCNKVFRKNLYHRKFSGIPRLSRYSCRNFSLSSSVGAVLDLLYTSRFTIASSFFSNPNRIISSPSQLSIKNIVGVEKITRMESVHFYFASVLLSRWQDSLFLRMVILPSSIFILATSNTIAFHVLRNQFQVPVWRSIAFYF